MILKKQAAPKRETKGIPFDLLACGKNSMLIKVYCKAGNQMPLHSHPHEQTGYLLSGKARLKFGNYDEILNPGDSYSIPGNTEHSLEALEDSTILDFFTPPREDYLS